MKKLIIAVAATMLGIVANAAAVTWNLTDVSDSPDVAKAGGWAAYIMAGSTYDTFSALTADKVADYVTANYAYQTSTVVGRGGVVSVSYTGGTYAASETVSNYLVLFNNATAGDATYYANTAVSSVTISEGGANAGLSFGSFASATSGWQTTAVPEPTSGLLMLLGMAGLALRRRRA